MGVEVSKEQAQERILKLQSRSERTKDEVLYLRGVKAKDLFKQMRAYLLHAHDERLISGERHTIHNLLRLAQKADKDTGEQYWIIAINDTRNFNNDPTWPRITRNDGAWFDPALTIREEGNCSEIIAYSFPIWFPEGSGLHHIRFDLNPPSHANENLGLRSHVHLNVDDEGFSVPTPLMHPLEILDVLLFSLRPGAEKVRTL